MTRPGDHDGRSELAFVDGALHVAHRRPQPILEENAQPDVRRVGGRDERVGARGRHVERLFDEDVQSAARGGDALLTVKPRGAADGHHVHRPMREKLLEVVVGDGTVLPREVHGFVTICANDRGDLNAGTLRAARMCVSVMPPAPINPICMGGFYRLLSETIEIHVDEVDGRRREVGSTSLIF